MIKKKQKELYNFLKENSIFACYWEKNKDGKFGDGFELPFIAISKSDDEKGYNGYYVLINKVLGIYNTPKVDKDGKYIREISFTDLTYKTLNQFKEGDDRIFVTNDVDEVLEHLIKRYND